jgi:hypothetical protein
MGPGVRRDDVERVCANESQIRMTHLTLPAAA